VIRESLSRANYELLLLRCSHKSDLAECRRHMNRVPKHPAHELYHALEESVKLPESLRPRC